jgi:Fe2+ transport system protein FeoA
MSPISPSCLADLSPGNAARVAAVGGAGSFRRRLLEIGLVPGTEVVRTGQAPLGDPLTFRIRGATLCLRVADARLILLASSEIAEAK